MSPRDEKKWIFHPRSVALVGVPPELGDQVNQLFLQPLLRLGYKGKIYLVHPRATSGPGFKAFGRIKEITDEIDYVISSIPARFTPELIRDCVAKRVKAVSLFTSGFSETGKEYGTRLEKEILEIARHNGIRVIGPNCLGLYCPKSGLGFGSPSPQKGPVGFLSQSGGVARILLEGGAERGIYFSKAVSYGNACDLNESDFLEYFASDPETKVITAYIEGVKNGSRFLKVLREAAKKKPVVVVKGGRTKSGTRAALSHTASLAGTWAVWEGIFKQAGVILASNLDELADLVIAFVLLPPPSGRRVGLMEISGGTGILSADICESAGLLVPQFSGGLLKKLSDFSPGPGTSIRNPIDSWSLFLQGSQERSSKAMKLVIYSNEVDLLIFEYFSPAYQSRWGLEAQAEGIIEAAKEKVIPVIIALPPPLSPIGWETYSNLKQKYAQAKIPVYPSVSRAAGATSKLIDYLACRQA